MWVKRFALMGLGLASLVLSLTLSASGTNGQPESSMSVGNLHAAIIAVESPKATPSRTPTITRTPTNTPTNTPACGLAWRSVPDPSTSSEFYSLAVISANDIWAVGARYINYTQAVAMHWDGIQWSLIPSANPGLLYSALQGVVAISTNDVWAVGWSSDSSYGLIEHWNGTTWDVVPVPYYGGSNKLFGISALSPGDIWAVGFTSFGYGNQQPLTIHWNGSQWSIIASPNPPVGENRFYGVAATSPNDVWAVGNSGGRSLIEHWDGVQWSIVPSPNPGSYQNFLLGVTAISANDAWAVGESAAPDEALTMHWDGTQWNVIPCPGTVYLRGVTAISTNDIWAVGYETPYGIMHWNGQQWTALSGISGTALYGVAAVNANIVWGVGSRVELYSDPCAISTSTPTPTNTPTGTPTPAPILVGHVIWQGPPDQPDARQQQPITLTLKLGTTEVNYPMQTTNAGGFFTVSLDGLANGVYSWRVKGPKYLANSGSISLTDAPTTEVEMGLMQAGDANNDNTISILDMNIEKRTFALCLGATGYDARGDFDNSDCVTLIDFNLLKSNFGLEGAQAP